MLIVLGANFGIIGRTRKGLNSSVLFEFEVREAADPANAASFKFGTLEMHQHADERGKLGAADAEGRNDDDGIVAAADVGQILVER
jgi:hypothetical protein